MAKFPELEQLVLNPLDYVLVVRVIQNETVISFYPGGIFKISMGRI